MSNHKTHYRSGKKRAITAEWRSLVLGRLNQIGKNPKWLARQIKASDGAVYALLTRQSVSGLVDAICATLDLPLPLQASDKVAEAAELVASQSPEKQQEMLAVLRALAGKSHLP